MQKNKGYRKLNRTSSERKAMLRSLSTNLLKHEKIKTTEPKAKELRRTVEKIITIAKNDNFNSRRRIKNKIYSEYIEELDSSVLQKLFLDIAPRYKERNGGYTRIIKLNNRKGDDATQVYIELV